MLGGGTANETLIWESLVDVRSFIGISVGLLGTSAKTTAVTSEKDVSPAIFSAYTNIQNTDPGAAAPKFVIKSQERDGLFLTFKSLIEFIS